MSNALLPLLAFAAAAAVLTVTPGVDTAMVLRSSASGGVRTGAAAGAGICLGLLGWGLAAAFGLTAVLQTSAEAFSVVKWMGAAYLVYLGARLLLKPRDAMAAPATEGPLRARELPAAFRRGLFTNLLNPKVGVFYVTFLPQFIPRGANVAAWSVMLAGVHVLLTLAWFAALIALTVPLGRALSRPPVVRALDRLTGCVFVGFGVKLALTERA